MTRSPFDLEGIVAAVGTAGYDWAIAADVLTWTPNATAVLNAGPEADLSSNSAYVQLLDPGGRQMRFETILHSPLRDQGAGVPYQLEYALAATPGAPAQWIEDSGRWYAGPDGSPARAVGLIRVVTDRHTQAERAAYLSQFDALTGEMNRHRLIDTLGEVIDEAVRMRASCAFLVVGIDNLALINESYGYDVADELIATIARRIRGKLRGQDHLGRFSGNKFGIVLRNCTPEDMAIAAERLLASMRGEVFTTQAGAIAVTVTIGGVSAPRHARNPREALARAQDALAAARARRRGSFQAYRPNVERDAQRLANVRSTDEIVGALNERRVVVMFEPIVATATRRPAFYESLLRVRRIDGSLIPAQEVVPAAERLGLVRLLDHRVLELVLDELIAAPALRASLNVSPPSTTDPDWWNGLGALMRAHPGVGERLTIEITETSVIHDLDETRGFVSRVKELGCRIAIDDFGAGYTSFRNLRKLGVDIVKIDGAFVQNMARSEDDRVFVQTLIDLAQRLHIETVAEWVKDEEAAALLAGWGCDYLQGELIGLASFERPWRDLTAAAS